MSSESRLSATAAESALASVQGKDRRGDDNTVVVRLAQHGDVPQIGRVREMVASERIYLGAEPPFTEEARKSYADTVNSYVASEVGLCLVAETKSGGWNREIVGALYLKPVYPTQTQRLNLGMFVAQNARGMGVGTRLVSSAVAWARKRAKAGKLHK